jgi:hypothetical protein
LVTAELDTLLIALYVLIDDLVLPERESRMRVVEDLVAAVFTPSLRGAFAIRTAPALLRITVC